MLKRLFAGLVGVTAALSMASFTAAATVFDDISLEGINAYESIITGSRNEIEDIAFTDLDKDGIPEMVVLFENEGARTDDETVEVYTLQNDKAVKIYSESSGSDEFDADLTKGNDGTIYLVIEREDDRNDDWFQYEFLYKSGNDMKREVKLNYDRRETSGQYKMNDSVITKSLYDATMKLYMDLERGSTDDYEARLEMYDYEDVYTVIDQAKTEKDTNIIKVYVNGNLLKTDSYPVIINGTTMVPMRDIFEALNSNVTWDSSTKSVSATKGNKAVKLTVNSVNAEVNGKFKVLSEAPYINENNTTMVPLRFISEALGADVDWNGETKVITINMK